MNRFRIAGLLIAASVSIHPVFADPTANDAASTTMKPTIDTHYSGGFSNDYSDELGRIQTMIPLAQLDMASQLGLVGYAQGFQHPVRVQFSDGGPAVAENRFFYIQFATPAAPFAQTLVVNVEAFAKLGGTSDKKDDELHRALNYEITELILNDIAGGDADRALPEWVQEGTAIHLSGMGEAFVEKTGSSVTKSHVGDLVDDLNRPQSTLTHRELARYYLGIRYIVHVGGSGAFQGFMSNMLKDPSAANAIQDALGQDWPTFEQNVRKFSNDAFLKYARNDDPSQSITTPRHKS